MMDMTVTYVDGTTEGFVLYTGVSTAFWLAKRLEAKKNKRVKKMLLDDGKFKWEHTFFA